MDKYILAVDFSKKNNFYFIYVNMIKTDYLQVNRCHALVLSIYSLMFNMLLMNFISKKIDIL